MPPVLTISGSSPAAARSALASAEPGGGGLGAALGRVGHQAGEAQPRQAVDQPRHGERLLRRCTPQRSPPVSHSIRTGSRSPAARIAASRPRATTSLSSVTVRRTRRASATRRVELGRAEQVVGQQDVVDAVVRHDLGLAQLLAGDADRAQRHLAVREFGDLVRLDVRAQPQAVLVGIGLGPAEVGLDAVEVDQDGGRVEIVDGPSHACRVLPEARQTRTGGAAEARRGEARDAGARPWQCREGTAGGGHGS